MRHLKSAFGKHRYLPSLLLLPAMFGLGLWLGGFVIPSKATAVICQANAIIASILPSSSTASTQKQATSTILASAGLPLTDGVNNGISSQPNGDTSINEDTQPDAQISTEENILIIPATAADSEDSNTTANAELTPQVVIYCTHASEEYAGQTRITGEAGGVIEVARTLSQEFEKNGIGTIFIDTLHDSPSYNDSYARSLETVTALAEEYPDIEIYIDVHRDSALAGVSTTLNHEGASYAKMLLIVGSDENLPHPNWEQNYAFAQTLTATCNELVEGIMRDPRVYSGRYNQHVGNKAILVEVGSTDNTEEEAKRSIAVLAQAIIKCMD